MLTLYHFGDAICAQKSRSRLGGKRPCMGEPRSVRCRAARSGLFETQPPRSVRMASAGWLPN